jgi:hypothetical protein
MFSFDHIKQYEQVYQRVIDQQLKNKIAEESVGHSIIQVDNIKQTINISPEELMLHLLRHYCSKIGNKSHKKLSIRLINQLELQTVENSPHLNSVFNQISNYIKSPPNPLSIQGDFFSLLVVFFRYHPELLHNIQPDTQGIYALLLLGVFAYDNSPYNYEREGLINLCLTDYEWDRKDQWVKLFLVDIIPYLSSPLLNELVEGTIKDSYNFFWLGLNYEPLPYQVPLLKLLVTAPTLPQDLHKKALKTLLQCEKNYTLPVDSSCLAYHFNPHRIIEPYKKVLENIFFPNRPHLGVIPYYDKGMIDAIPLFFLTLTQEQQAFGLNALLHNIENTSDYIWITILMTLQYLFPEYEEQISHRLRAVSEKEMKDYCSSNGPRYDHSTYTIPAVLEICSLKTLFTFRENEKNVGWNLALSKLSLLPKSLISLIVDYLLPHYFEKYHYEYPISTARTTAEEKNKMPMISSSSAMLQTLSKETILSQVVNSTLLVESKSLTTSSQAAIPKKSTYSSKELYRERFISSYDERQKQKLLRKEQHQVSLSPSHFSQHGI